jgi:CheY-like chemotaxis protein
VLTVTGQLSAGRIEGLGALVGNSAGPRVLVVDDLSEMRVLIHRALTGRGYQVDVAATIDAARGMDPGGYDALLVDAHLGPEQGTDLIERLLTEDPTAATRCLVITGGTTGGLPEGVAYLAKPFQLDQLIDAVSALTQPGAVAAAGRRAGITPDSPAGQPASVPAGGHQPAAGEPRAWHLLGLTRRLRARERHELVDFLHDGPIQELTALTLELQMTCRSSPDAPRFDAVLQRLDTAAGSLRWLIDGQWPFLAPETHLDAALRQRTAWLLAAPVTVDIDEQGAGLGTSEVQVVVDVAELMLLALVTARPAAQVHVAVRAEAHQIQIDLTLMSAAGDSQAIGGPAQAQSALDGLATALGTSAHAQLCGRSWRAQIALPREPAGVPERSGTAREQR